MTNGGAPRVIAPHPGASSCGVSRDGAAEAPGVAPGLDDPGPGPGASALPHVVRVDGPALALPGLDDPATAGRPVGALEQAVRRTLAALDEQDAISEVDAGRVALALELSQIIADKRATRRTSTVGNDARVLMDILDELAPAAAGEGDLMLRRAMDEWSATIAAHEAAERERAASHGDAQVRNPA